MFAITRYIKQDVLKNYNRFITRDTFLSFGFLLGCNHVLKLGILQGLLIVLVVFKEAGAYEYTYNNGLFYFYFSTFLMGLKYQT